MFSTVFGVLPSATGAELDVNFNQAGLLGSIPCTVSGTNALVLTPYTVPTVGTPPLTLQPLLRVSCYASGTNTTGVTADVAGTGNLIVYKDTSAGPVVLTGSEIVQGNYVVLTYDATLTAGAGGWHLENSLTSGAPSGTAGGDLGGTYPNPTVSKINGVALGSTTATAGHLLVGSGAAWASVAMSGDATLASSGAITVSKTSGTNFSGLATATFVAPTSWTPTDGSGAGLTFSSVSANYTRNANMVFAYATVTYPSTADTSHAIISGLPIAVPNQTYAAGPAPVYISGGSIVPILAPIPNGSTAGFQNQASGANVTNANLSGLTVKFMLIFPAS